MTFEVLGVTPLAREVMAWEMRCVRCDGVLVGRAPEGLCTLCEQGEPERLWEAPSLRYEGKGWEQRLDDADWVVVEALMVGHRFEGSLLPERCAAARELLRRRPDLERGEIAMTVGLHVRTVTRMLHHMYQKVQKRPSREDVIEKLMTGKVNRIEPTSDERREAIRRLIRQGAGDAAIAKITGLKVAAIAGQRHRMREQGEDAPSGRAAVRTYAGQPVRPATARRHAL